MSTQPLHRHRVMEVHVHVHHIHVHVQSGAYELRSRGFAAHKLLVQYITQVLGPPSHSSPPSHISSAGLPSDDCHEGKTDIILVSYCLNSPCPPLPLSPLHYPLSASPFTTSSTSLPSPFPFPTLHFPPSTSSPFPPSPLTSHPRFFV